jgi:hypothetical protein
MIGLGAVKRFGSGWAWLSLKGGKLNAHSTANHASAIGDGTVPNVGIDGWEHAYYLNHQNGRADYLDAFWGVVDWELAGGNLAASQAWARAPSGCGDVGNDDLRMGAGGRGRLAEEFNDVPDLGETLGAERVLNQLDGAAQLVR